MQVLAACSLIKNLNPKYYLFSQPSSSNPTPYLDFKPILNNTPSQHNSQASTNPEIIWLTVTKFKVKYFKSLWTLCKRSRNYNRIKAKFPHKTREDSLSIFELVCNKFLNNLLRVEILFIKTRR